MGISVFWPPRKNHKKVAKKWPPADLSYRKLRGLAYFPHIGATPFFNILGHFCLLASPIGAKPLVGVAFLARDAALANGPWGGT